MNGNSYYSGGYQGYQSYSSPGGLVIPVTKKGKELPSYEVPWMEREWVKIAAEVFPAEERGPFNDKFLAVRVPVELVKAAVEVTLSAPSFQPCLYTSVSDFAAALWGRKLEYSDQDWLAMHQHATAGGIEMPYSMSCAHQLVEPYGLGVSRVRVPAGELAEHPEMQLWIRLLGCNPFALLDNRTTNEEAAQRLGMTLEQANDAFRFEFGEEPLRPSVVGEERGGIQTTHATTAAGHARYLAPRGKLPADWRLCLQVAPLDRVSYKAPLNEIPAYKPRELESKERLILSKLKRPDGKPVAEAHGVSWYRPGEKPAWAGGAYYGGNVGAAQSSGGKTVSVHRRRYDPQTNQWYDVIVQEPVDAHQVFLDY